MIIWTRRGIIIASATALLLNIIYICASRYAYSYRKTVQAFRDQTFHPHGNILHHFAIISCIP